MILIIGFHHDSGVIQTSPGVTRPAKTRMINLVIRCPHDPGVIENDLASLASSNAYAVQMTTSSAHLTAYVSIPEILYRLGHSLVTTQS